MRIFNDWFNLEQNIDLVLKAAIAHLGFVTLHPFEDENGAISDFLTSRSLVCRQFVDKPKFRTRINGFGVCQ